MNTFQLSTGVAEILGVKVNLVNYSQTIASMEEAIKYRSTLTISFVNVHSIMTSQGDIFLKTALNGSSLSVPDGMPLVWISKWTDTPLYDRVYGPDIFQYFCELSEDKGYTHFFYGSSPQVLIQLVKRISKLYPKINIVGYISPPYHPITTEEQNSFIHEINRSKADVLWVGLGCPKQEKWIYEFREKIQVPVIAGIGAAFNIHAKELRQAPSFWQRHGLEWLFRLIQEPRRLGFRYLVYNPLFIIKVTVQIIKGGFH